ncbi:Hypothetical_protein [Hexamita inflata]|uniref:Hypothetical_protein n=1 Tax=Hexamita inflata TaxID=28002 RepID=A0AA86NWZ2_9EUKA|nr:Hypothetical protein HINF_LOCUS15807 [Hexamita inflata]
MFNAFTPQVHTPIFIYAPEVQHQQTPLFITKPVFWLQVQILFTIYEFAGQLQVFPTIEEYSGQTHQLPEIYALEVIHVQIPFIKLAPEGQLQVFEILRLLIPQVHILLLKNAPVVEQMQDPF